MKLLFTCLCLSLLLACNNDKDEKITNTNTGGNTPTLPSPKHTDSITAAVLSQVAYCTNPQQVLDQYLPGWKVTWAPKAVNGNYGFVCTDGHTMALAIRGSLMQFNEATFDNWIKQDLNAFTQSKWPYTDSIADAKVSNGSYQGWQNMNALKDSVSGQSLWDFFNANTQANTPILITGHSLGGNLSTIYASWLWWNFKNQQKERTHINVITFAAPAAGNKAFAQNFNEIFPLSRRYENTNDMVPKFPCDDGIRSLGKLYVPTPAASQIKVGYKSLTASLSDAFDGISLALQTSEFFNGQSYYTQTNGSGYLITIPLDSANLSNTAGAWFGQAGYQHSMVHYAKQLGAPQVVCQAN
jgi:triacylglycerol lipase